MQHMLVHLLACACAAYIDVCEQMQHMQLVQHVMHLQHMQHTPAYADYLCFHAVPATRTLAH